MLRAHPRSTPQAEIAGVQAGYRGLGCGLLADPGDRILVPPSRMCLEAINMVSNPDADPSSAQCLRLELDIVISFLRPQSPPPPHCRHGSGLCYLFKALN